MQARLGPEGKWMVWRRCSSDTMSYKLWRKLHIQVACHLPPLANCFLLFWFRFSPLIRHNPWLVPSLHFETTTILLEKTCTACRSMGFHPWQKDSEYTVLSTQKWAAYDRIYVAGSRWTTSQERTCGTGMQVRATPALFACLMKAPSPAWQAWTQLSCAGLERDDGLEGDLPFSMDLIWIEQRFVLSDLFALKH